MGKGRRNGTADEPMQGSRDPSLKGRRITTRQEEEEEEEEENARRLNDYLFILIIAFRCLCPLSCVATNKIGEFLPFYLLSPFCLCVGKGGHYTKIHIWIFSPIFAFLMVRRKAKKGQVKKASKRMGVIIEEVLWS